MVQTPQAAKKETDSSLHITIDERELSPEDTVDAPPGLEEQVKATIDELKEVNLSTAEHPCPTYVITLLTLAEEVEYTALLTEFRDVAVLAAPTQGKPLIFYVAAQVQLVGVLLAHENEEGKEN
ncbi:hypothetical protein LIER_01093 [Lithospermum erythrorhizon]|uniref:Uncharacterized protein n=1 Tax=Lithospermum erythrorhizon TaxID=34254 RepID=A0AAV3NKF8_LITER